MTRTLTRTGVETSRSRTEPSDGGGILRVAVIVLAVGVLLPLASTVFALYDHITDWGKLVHAVDGACATFLFGLLLLGWREDARVELTDEVTALLTLFAGVLFGVLWEVVEFVRDWVAYSDLQKSNTDTMTDFLCNNLATVIAALVVMRVYCRAIAVSDRKRLGEVAERLVHGPSRVLDRHGLALLTLAACAIAACIALLWFAGRPVPGLPIP